MSVVAPDRYGPVERLAGDYTDSASTYARLWGPTLLPLARPLLDELPLGDARRVLDVGAGAGDLLSHLRSRAPGAEVVGVDRSPGMLAEAAARGRGPLAVADARALAVRDETVDVLTLAFVLFHLPRPAAGLREARRVLRAGGAVGLVTWSVENPPLPADGIWREELDRHGAAPDPREASVRRYDSVDRPRKLARLFESAGFDPVCTRTQGFERHWDPGALWRCAGGVAPAADGEPPCPRPSAANASAGSGIGWPTSRRTTSSGGPKWSTPWAA